MARGSSAAQPVLVFLSFLVVAAVQSWPLPLHIGTHLTGNPGGDTAVYVWNTWVFRHELIDQQSWPFTTEAVLGLAGPVDLGLHNYTVFANLLALVVRPWLDVVATFNVIYLINVALAGFGAYLLVRHVGRSNGVRAIDAWLAGLFFACSPFLVARSTAHFSLVAAAPLPFFALCVDRAWQHRTIRHAVAAGVCMAWAAYCDVYYAVYCVLIGVVLVTVRTVTWVRREPRARLGWMPWLDLPLIGAAALIIAAAGTDGAWELGSLRISMRSLYTPVLILTLLAAVRIARTWPIRVSIAIPPTRQLLTPLAAGSLAALVLMAPMLYALAMRVRTGTFVSPPVLWRSSAPGLDVASFVVPNPNHPLAPSALVEWIDRRPGRFEENVAAIPWTALVLLVIAWRWAAYRPDRLWLTNTIVFLSLAIGPFVRIAGVNTYVPTPWAVLRYVPLLDQARMPTRFGVLVTLSVAVLFAGALAAVVRRWPGRARLVTGLLAGALAIELLPAPRRLSAATIPEVFETIAADPRPVSVLTLPFGIRDGLSSIGDFSASTLLFQTYHGKPVVGGYLSRVSERRKNAMLADPVLSALAVASEGSEPGVPVALAARDAAAAFVARTRLGWVVVEQSRVSPALLALAKRTLNLREVQRSGDFVLFAVDENEAAGADAASVRPGAPHDVADDANGTDD